MIETILLLGALLQQPPAKAPEIPALIENLKADEPAVRREAVEALVERAVEALPIVLATLADEHTGIEQQVDDLVKRLASKDWKSRDAAQQELVRLGRHARARLEKHAGSDDPEVAWRVKAALAEIEERRQGEGEANSVRDACLFEFLGRAGDLKGVPPLLKRFDSAAGDARQVSGTELDVRVRLLEALGRLRKGLSTEQADAAAELAYKIAIQNRDRRQIAILIRTLGRLRSGTVTTSLISMVKNGERSDVHLKRLVMRALSAIGDARGAAAIVEAAAADEVYLREAAIETLAEMAGEDFGLDPRESPEASRARILAARRWWEKKYGKAWTE